ncbi:MAG: SulP family inorganic anion transporter [Gemmatimonadota bacterium]
MTLRGYARELRREAFPEFSSWSDTDTRSEVIAGAVCGVLVIPQAITFAYLAGLPPEFGLYCAVFVAFLTSFFGTTPMLAGPNTAMSILLGSTILPFAGRGSPLYIEYALLLSIMVGVVQLLIWLLRGAELFRYFSPAAISGIKTGVGVLLIASAVEGAFGMTTMKTQFFYEKFYIAFASWDELVNPYAALVSSLTIGSGLVMRRRWRRTYIVGAVLIGGATGALLVGFLGPVRTDLELLGRIPMGLFPFRLPSVTHEDVLVMQEMVPSAIALAVLGLSQSLVIAQDLKSDIGSRVSLGREVFAQGVGNLVGPLFSGFAGSGSFNRTAIAVEMGGRSTLTGLVAALSVGVIAKTLGPVLTYVPMSTIAGIIALVGIGMIEVKHARRFAKMPIDAAVFALTVLTITLIGLEAGILVAAASSLLFFVVGASRLTFSFTTQGDTEIIAVKGNLFFATLDALKLHLAGHPGGRTRLDLTRVPYCDSSALEMIESIRLERERRGGGLEVVRG